MRRQFVGQSGPVDSERRANVGEHDLAGDPIEREVAAGGQCGEAVLDLALEPAAGGAGEGPVAQVEAELAALVADEVEHGEARLVVGETQTAAELLQEHRARSRSGGGRAPCRSRGCRRPR